MIRSTLALPLSFALAAPWPQERGAPEPWADATLPVKEGLALWLDASRQDEAALAAGRAAPADGAGLGVWSDGSGRRRDLVQRERGAQPRLVHAGGGALVRFDGVDDALAATGLGATLGDFTLFVRGTARSNAGGFRGFVAANGAGRNDYQSGFTLDLSWAPTAKLEALNVEGLGFGGAVDLLQDSFELGGFHTLAVAATRATKEDANDGVVALFVDGRAQGTRPRARAALALDELSVGARFYSNTSDVPCATGFLDGDLLEVLLFERVLPDAERALIDQWLARKHAPTERALAGAARFRRVELEPAKPPPVQFLVPGFAARALPVDLPNVNGLRFREDGVLVALAYDGDVWLIDDPDRGRGNSMRTRRFFRNPGSIAAPIGMALTPPGYARGRGLFVACKEKIVLIADRDGDDAAETELVVASGWPPGAIPHNVDALGVALAPDGRLFFGLGTSDYTNGWLVDASGAGHYDRASERGAILEVSPDLESRRIFCTGIRFPVGLAFNRAGDLFATDQEGATWLPNGNPFDELLHVVEGRHYGFPPRHPRHLPDVIDEPSLYDYGPQHESTCGLCFDEPAEGAALFGPVSFEGDVLVAGYSRGKLFRTELARARAGYVARTQLLARFDQLVCDVALSPAGDLVVASHSGSPDWGSGPAGRGTLWQLSFRDERPMPLFAWAAGPDEIRVAFDRPLDPTELSGALARTRVTFGEFVAAGDRFELHRPGYATVERQLAAPRFDLPVESLRLVEGGRTLSLRTAAHSLAGGAAGGRRVAHALELPIAAPAGALVADLAYDLNGVEARWKSADGSDSWSGWLPHVDLAVARAFTKGSREHEGLWERLARPGALTLSGALDLGDMLRPRVQPGSRLDYVWPDEEVTIALGSGKPFTVRPRHGELVPFDVTIATGTDRAKSGAPPTLDVEWHTAEDPRPRPLELRRLFPPWAMRIDEGGGEEIADAGAPAHPELAGGSWSRGRAVFFGDDAMCSRCHTLQDGSGRGATGRIGPDLSRLWQRDFASVRKDVLEPSSSIHPDHLAWALTLADGRELAGVPRRERRADGAEVLIVGEPGGKETTIRPDAIVARQLLPISIMPSGLQNVLSEEQRKDLFTYLLTPPLAPAAISIDGAPPSRDRATLAALLEGSKPPKPAGAAATPTPPPPLKVLLVSGPKDHGVDEHDYPDWRERWSRLLALADGVEVGTAEGWPEAAPLSAADVVVMYSANPGWTATRGGELDRFLARGGGLVLLHYAVNGRDAVPELAQRIGLAWRDGASRFRHGAVALDFSKAPPDHPITRGIFPVARSSAPPRFVDETYWGLEGDERAITPLATSLEEGSPRPQLWTREVGRGRLFVSLLGHYRWTFDDPLFRLLILRAIAWSAHQPADRLAELATIGAR